MLYTLSVDGELLLPMVDILPSPEDIATAIVNIMAPSGSAYEVITEVDLQIVRRSETVIIVCPQ